MLTCQYIQLLAVIPKMKTDKESILAKMKSKIDYNKYKFYSDSFESNQHYALINYQSISMVDHNIPDDDMIYGIGTLLYRMVDNKVFEIYSHVDREEQISKILKEG